MDFIKQQWPLILIAAWFLYRFVRGQQMKKRIPELRKRGAYFLDVRTQAEFAGAHAENSHNIPLDQLNKRVGEIPQNVPVVVCCASGTRSGMAAMVLKKNKIKEVYNVGSWTAIRN